MSLKNTLLYKSTNQYFLSNYVIRVINYLNFFCLFIDTLSSLMVVSQPIEKGESVLLVGRLYSILLTLCSLRVGYTGFEQFDWLKGLNDRLVRLCLNSVQRVSLLSCKQTHSSAFWCFQSDSSNI